MELQKTIFTSLTILCLLSVLFLMGCTLSVKANPTTWTVDDDGTADFNTIQEAINNATSGDMIFVSAGIYYENVVVNKSVSLIGEDQASTIIDGYKTGNVISIIMANNISIEGFTVKGSGTHPYNGISIDHSSDVDISRNTITNNHYGVSLYSSSNNVFSGNTISSNDYYGVSLYSSSNNVFSGNTISSNQNDGISLYLSSNNVFSGNTISSNNYYGIYFALGSKNNIIYCNNFNNIYQVRSDSTNVWDDGYKGNYWSDYTGQDLNGDGIGDTTHVMDVNNQDTHPLMGTFSDFKVTLKRGNYHVNTICNSTISNFRFEIGLETGNKIIRFNVTGEDNTVGFCRTMIPTDLMNYSYIVLVDLEEIQPTRLENFPSETYVHLYFTYMHSSHTITIISSLARMLEKDLYDLNATYHALRNNYTELQKGYLELNDSYQEHLNSYNVLLGNYSELNDSYHDLLLDYSIKVHNIQHLMYIFATITAIFLIITIYLSKRAHGIATLGVKMNERSKSGT